MQHAFDMFVPKYIQDTSTMNGNSKAHDVAELIENDC